MEKYVNKIKSAMNGAIEMMLSKKESIKLISGYTIVVRRVEEVLVVNFTELKLMDFVGGRKFEVDGEGKFNVVEELQNGEKKQTVAFRIRNGVVKFNDLTQSFEVLTIGEFNVLDFVK